MDVLYLEDKKEDQANLVESSTSGYSALFKRYIEVSQGETGSFTEVFTAESNNPNQETIKAIQEIENGDAITCADEEDFFRKLKS